jgi:hypothetical protein
MLCETLKKNSLDWKRIASVLGNIHARCEYFEVKKMTTITTTKSPSMSKSLAIMVGVVATMGLVEQ